MQVCHASHIFRMSCLFRFNFTRVLGDGTSRYELLYCLTREHTHERISHNIFFYPYPICVTQRSVKTIMIPIA